MSRKTYFSLVACIVTVLGLAPMVHQGTATPANGLNLTATRGIVGSTVGVIVAGFGAGDPVDILWDGRSIVKVTIDPATGFGSAWFRVPAATKGNHSVSAYRGGTVIGPKLFEVIPRIKIVPGMAGWGEQVNVSLRGYAPLTLVRIRWLRDGIWVELAHVSTSRTGSANVFVTVPTWAPVGTNAVRGDAVLPDGGRAQTNGFRADRLITIAGAVDSTDQRAGSPTPAAPVPTPTATPTSTPSPAGTPLAQASG
jgi:hypothetical protein